MLLLDATELQTRHCLLQSLICTQANNPGALLQLLHCQAWAALEVRDLSRAASALREAQAVIDQGAGNDSIRGQIELRRAELAMLQKDPAAAQRHADRALSLVGYRTARPQRSLAMALIGAAEVALVIGHASDVERFAAEGLRLSERVARQPDSSADVGESLLLLVKSMPDSPLAERASSCGEQCAVSTMD